MQYVHFTVAAKYFNIFLLYIKIRWHLKLKGGKIPLLHIVFPISAGYKSGVSAICTGITETQLWNADKLPCSIIPVLLLTCIWNDWQENLAVRNYTSVSCMMGCSFLVPHFQGKYCSLAVFNKMYSALCGCMCASNFGLWRQCVWLQKLVPEVKPKNTTKQLTYHPSYYWTHRDNNQSNKFKISIVCPNKYILRKAIYFKNLFSKSTFSYCL